MNTVVRDNINVISNWGALNLQGKEPKLAIDNSGHLIIYATKPSTFFEGVVSVINRIWNAFLCLIGQRSTDPERIETAQSEAEVAVRDAVGEAVGDAAEAVTAAAGNALKGLKNWGSSAVRSLEEQKAIPVKKGGRGSQGSEWSFGRSAAAAPDLAIGAAQILH